MNPEFSSHNRDQSLRRFERETFDLVIIGGGITGAGAARDAASRGMSVALIEAQDFAQGTSSRSSKLIHGGIRYLENLEFHLVFEALSERRLLFDLAPHLVHPLRFVLPLYKGARVGMFKMSLGMWLYDALSMFEAPEMHERLSAEESLNRLPLLRSQELLGSFEYSDAYMDDDRLVIETLRSAASKGAVCANFVKATGATLEDGRVTSIDCTDQVNQKKFKIHARQVISTVGPWTDIVGNELLKGWKKILRPSKGVHLTFDRKRFPLRSAVVMAEGKRIVFGIPRHEMVIVGTTETDYTGDPALVSATPEDVEYLITVANEYFPGAHLQVSDIIATYAGVRPLVYDGAATEGKTSREHTIFNDPRGITFVAGGKYTTYRLMAQQTVEAALETFSLEDQVRFRTSDTLTALNPLATKNKIDQARAQAEDWSERFGLDLERTLMLIERHGAEAFDILEQADLSHVRGNLSGDQLMWTAEAQHAIRNTMCLSLVDFYTRRSPLFLSRHDHGLSLLRTLSLIFQTAYGWSDDRMSDECERVMQYMQTELAWQERLS
jgi:glycerol-3-phosphate dehydrogenase